MSQTQEEQWALALQKTKHQTNHARRTPIADRQASLVVDINNAKKKLKQALRQKQKSASETALQKLLKLRATQTALELEAWQETYGKPDANTVRLFTRQYAEDCMHLIDAVARRLATL